MCSLDTPASDRAIKLFAEFTARLRERLEAGRQTYGDISFQRPREELIEEICQELLDVAGWAFILYCRIDNLEVPNENTSAGDHHGVDPDRID